MSVEFDSQHSEGGAHHPAVKPLEKVLPGAVGLARPRASLLILVRQSWWPVKQAEATLWPTPGSVPPPSLGSLGSSECQGPLSRQDRVYLV